VNYRPSKSFLLGMSVLCPLVIAFSFGLLPELASVEKPPLPGEITFRAERPDFKSGKHSIPSNSGNASIFSLGWIEDSYHDLMSWDKNPWKTKFADFGDHYSGMAYSKDPKEQARAAEIRRLADALHKRLLERYPELAVASKNVPPERNGFLKWLEFSERHSPTLQPKGLDFSKKLQEHLSGKGPWNSAAAKAWLDQQKPLMDEIRTIGLMPEQSIEGIDVHRYAFASARLAKSCSEALLLDARLAAENGDAAAAIASIQASNGLAAHLADVETPSLLSITVQILLQMQTQSYALKEVMPALPPGQLDPAAWEKALNPKVSGPEEFARIMRGEWNVCCREYLLPPLLDAEETRPPPDPDALIDVYAAYFVNVVGDHEGLAVTDWPNIPTSDIPETSHLSRRSRKLIGNLFIGERAWRKGMERSLSSFAMTQAAFAIMKGQPIPMDPIYGQLYRWDPATRLLSSPDTEAFQKLELKPINVPKP
jgi:hypothetical protein